jgi:hypothetical protein
VNEKLWQDSLSDKARLMIVFTLCNLQTLGWWQVDGGRVKLEKEHLDEYIELLEVRRFSLASQLSADALLSDWIGVEPLSLDPNGERSDSGCSRYDRRAHGRPLRPYHA